LEKQLAIAGRATSAKIFGKAGSVVTFFDDQQFRTGQNYVVIETLGDNPIEVRLSRNFVETDVEAGNGVYRGETREFRWVLFKNVAVSDSFWDKVKDAVTGKAIEKILEELGIEPTIAKGPGGDEDRSNNYRVDNCSSVRFGL
jgi:hypothetical protein